MVSCGQLATPTCNLINELVQFHSGHGYGNGVLGIWNGKPAGRGEDLVQQATQNENLTIPGIFTIEEGLYVGGVRHDSVKKSTWFVLCACAK